MWLFITFVTIVVLWKYRALISLWVKLFKEWGYLRTMESEIQLRKEASKLAEQLEELDGRPLPPEVIRDFRGKKILEKKCKKLEEKCKELEEKLKEVEREAQGS